MRVMNKVTVLDQIDITVCSLFLPPLPPPAWRRAFPITTCLHGSLSLFKRYSILYIQPDRTILRAETPIRYKHSKRFARC